MSKKQTTKLVRLKTETVEALGKLVEGFETPDDVIRRLIAYFQKGKIK